MTKLQLLHRALNERLMAAVEQIMEMVGGTVLEYEEETIRARKENEALRRRLRYLEGASSAGWQGPSEPVTLSIPDESNPSQQDYSAINFEFGPESNSMVIKTESTHFPLCGRPENSAATLPQSADLASDNPGTSAGVSWESAQNYMAPLDFDPTPGPKRGSQWSGQSRRQRMSFACPDCGKVFGAKQRLLIHMRIHSTERPYTYRRRKECFYGEKGKQRNLNMLSKISREVVDDLSDGSEQINRSSASPDWPEVHIPVQEEEGFIESYTDKKTKSTMRRRRGRKRLTQMTVCPYCPGRQFTGNSQLAMHMKIHKDKSPMNALGQTQSSTNAVVEADRKLHKVTFLPKRYCSKVWDYFSKDSCGYVFCHECAARISQGSSKGSQKNTSNLWAHLRSKHQHAYLEAKTYSQPVNRPMNTLDTTPIKLEDIEPEDPIEEGGSEMIKKQGKGDAVKKTKVAAKRDFPCPECDKAFALKTKLIFHMNSHRSKKVFLQKSLEMAAQNKPVKEETVAVTKTTVPCPHCNRKFIRGSSLKAHIRILHREIEPLNILLGQRKSKRLLKQRKRKRRAEAKAKAVIESLKTETETNSEGLTMKCRIAEKLGLETEDSETVTTENQGVTEKTEESEVNDKPNQSCQESSMVVDELKISADEGAGLNKLGMDECASEKTETHTSSTNVGSTKKIISKKYPCKVCGKQYSKTKIGRHRKTHAFQLMNANKKRKRDQEEEERLRAQTEKRRKEEDDEEMLDEEMSTSLDTKFNPTTTQTPQGFPNKDLLQKSKTRGQGPLPCPFCGKVFAWEMRLLMHMQIHCGEKPYPYRQRKKHFYGVLKRGQLPNNQETHGNNSDESEQSAFEETVNEDKSTHLSTESTALEDCSGQPEQTATIVKENPKTIAQQMSDVMSHFHLQPRIVLKPISTEYKNWSSVSGEDIKSAHPETSGIDHEQPSCSVLSDKQTEDAFENKTVNSNSCTTPVKSPAVGVQNSPEKCCSFISPEDIVSVVVCSPQRDSQYEVLLDNDCDSLGIKSSDVQQEEDHDCNLVSETIIIDDKPEEPKGETTFQSALSECLRTNCDCNIHSMKLTVMPDTGVVESLFKETSSSAVQRNASSLCVILSDSEDSVDEDVLSSYEPTAPMPGVQNKPLDVGRKPSEMSSSDSKCPEPEGESINTDGDDSLLVHTKTIDAPSKETDVEVVPTESMESITSVCVVLSDCQHSVDKDMLSSYRPTASVQNKPLDVESKPSEKFPNDSNFSALDKAESINTDDDDSLCVLTKSIDTPSKETEFLPTESMESSTADDPLTRDQMTSAALRQVEDSSMNLEEILSNTTNRSNTVFDGQASVSEVIAGSDNSAL